jgi:hypothetical protein
MASPLSKCPETRVAQSTPKKRAPRRRFCQARELMPFGPTGARQVPDRCPTLIRQNGAEPTLADQNIKAVTRCNVQRTLMEPMRWVRGVAAPVRAPHKAAHDRCKPAFSLCAHADREYKKA